jgi:hypothetical protein
MWTILKLEFARLLVHGKVKVTSPAPRIEPVPKALDEGAIRQLEAHTIEVFGDDQAALEWLQTPLWELSNLSPRKWLAEKGAPGLEAVNDVLLRIEYGVYS